MASIVFNCCGCNPAYLCPVYLTSLLDRFQSNFLGRFTTLRTLRGLPVLTALHPPDTQLKLLGYATENDTLLPLFDSFWGFFAPFFSDGAGSGAPAQALDL
jgi:hypothetical protein